MPRAVVIRSTGGPEVLALEEHDPGAPPAGAVRVRVHAAGDVALVHAAAGGVGLLLVQMLKAAGARVIGTCSTAEKEALAHEAGADDVVRYTERDFVAETRRLTAGRGVDVVYDSVGATTF